MNISKKRLLPPHISLMCGVAMTLLVIALVFGSLSFASEKASTSPDPSTGWVPRPPYKGGERLEGQWIEAVGQAYQGELDMPKEVRERAKRDAESKAIEQAVGTFIKVHTLVSNYQIAEDLIYTAVRGKIEKIEIIKEGWDDKDRHLYKVHLKALIEPVYSERGWGFSVKLSLQRQN